MAFLACDDDTAAQGFADYLFPTFGVDASYSRVAGMWNFLGEIHSYDATLGSSYGGSDSRVFSYIADGVCHHPTRHREYMYKPPPRNELAPAMGDWVNTFLTTGFPYQVSPRPARVGGPSYTQYELCKASALAELKTDPHADKYWCCVQDFLKPGTTYQTGNFNGKHANAPSATEWGCPAWTPPVIECVDDDAAAHKAALEYGVLKEGQKGKCKDFAHICEFLPDPSTNPCPLTCGLCIPGGMCERFDHDPPLTTLKIWKDDFCSSNLIGDNESAKVAIAKVTTKLCLPCDPRGATDYVCPKGYSCTRNVLAGDIGCSEYCCTMCKLGEYCPEVCSTESGRVHAHVYHTF